jgi:LPPG:FO 2-phospho-L-lactate transferase
LQRAKALGATGWFNLGDVDLGLHLFRSELLAQGVALAEVTRRICLALGVQSTVLPMCEAFAPTRLDTDRGELHLQEYLVKFMAEPVVRQIRFDGIAQARPSPGIPEALSSGKLVVIAPSNPLISIGPILAVPGMREAIVASDALKVAVSPIVGGKSLKGPSDRMLSQLGHDVSPLGVARLYADLIDVFVVDRQDASAAQEIEALGMDCIVAETVMTDLGAKQNLAKTLLDLVQG